MSILGDAWNNVTGQVQGAVTTVVSEAQGFAEDIVAAGASVLNNFLNALAGPAAKDKIISEFSTQNSYIYTDDEYIDNLHNTDRIVLNSLIKGTSLTDEVIAFYRKEYASSDFSLEKALDIVEGNNITYCPAAHGISGNFAPFNDDFPFIGAFDFGRILPSVTLRVNNLNLFEGDTSVVPSVQYAGNNSNESNFPWHSSLTPDFGYVNVVTLDSSTLATVQTNTKDYLKALGMPDPENLLDDLPYTQGTGAPGGATYSDVIDSVFLNFRVKWISDNRISNKYLWILAEKFYYMNGMPHVLTYDNDDEEVWMLQYEVIGDGHNYTMGMSHISRSVDNPTSHADYQYDKNLTSSDGYYYYDANKTLPSGDHSAQTQGDLLNYVTDSSVGTAEIEDNWLEIERNSVTVTINGVDSVFPDEIDLTATYYPYTGPLVNTPGPTITLTMFSHTVPAVPAHHIWTSTGCPGPNATNLIHYGCTVGGVVPSHLDTSINTGWYTYVAAVAAYDVWKDADDQVLRVGNLYIKKSSTEITFATVPPATYSQASITYGKSNTSGVTFYTVHNVTAMERITDYANEVSGANTSYRYVSHKLDASNNCVSAPILTDILEDLDPFERHQLILASANISMHLAYYKRIEKTWEEKLRAATLEVIRIGAIVYTVITLGAAGSFAALAEAAVVAYATSLAVNVFIEQILVPAVIRNFGEDEALVVLAVAAVAIAYYSRKGSTTGLNQFPNQAALFTTSVDIMNQMYTLAVVQPGIIEMQKEQDEWTATDNELTEKEEAFQEDYEAVFGTEDSPSHLLNLQIRAALNPMPASAYFSYHDGMLERQFDCFDYDKYNELNVS